MGCVARDVPAIPGVSVSDTRLFSNLKHTLTDARSCGITKFVGIRATSKQQETKEEGI
ncbi:hypothetical protein C8R47DRAFT_999506 [Mycena vitilis]|nr:hypothetical protein C8R47DRAFT_999506 [Mycena vitilis]